MKSNIRKYLFAGIGCICLAAAICLMIKKECILEENSRAVKSSLEQWTKIDALIQKETEKELLPESETEKEILTETEKDVSTESAILSVLDIQKLKAGSLLDEKMFLPEMTGELFYGIEISEEIQQRIWDISYRENDDISLDDLRYLRVLHWGFDGKTHIGELIVNKSIAEDILEIMEELYQNNYPIEKMILVDEYGGDDESSMSDNNTSSFNYRLIAGSNKLSKHSLGYAIDINPKYNPYVKKKSNGETIVSPNNAWDYVNRNRDFPYKMDENDLCVKLFKEKGFTWGGSWNSVKDYQHFEK